MKTDNLWQVDIQQGVFRELVEAFSRPGTIQDLAAYLQDDYAHHAVLATMVDAETTLADPHALLDKMQWPLLQARQVPTEHARFIIAEGKHIPDFLPALGSLHSPEYGATLIIKVDAIGRGPLSMRLTGPGISQQRELCVAGMNRDWISQRENWVAGFPLGVDIVLCSATQITALPRTTCISNTHIDEGAA